MLVNNCCSEFFEAAAVRSGASRTTISPLISIKWEVMKVAWHPGQALARSVQGRQVAEQTLLSKGYPKF